jgi:hypothetical protein
MNRLEKKKKSKLTTKVQNTRKEIRPKNMGKIPEIGPAGASQEKLR